MRQRYTLSDKGAEPKLHEFVIKAQIRRITSNAVLFSYVDSSIGLPGNIISPSDYDEVVYYWPAYT